MRREFDSPTPVHLHVENPAGRVDVTAPGPEAGTARTTVEITGDRAEEFVVEQQGEAITVVAPRHRTGFLGLGGQAAVVTVSVPAGSDLELRTGSGDIDTRGGFGTCRLKAGSGDVRLSEAHGPAVVETGSGDSHVGTAHRELRVRTGSGDATIDHVGGTLGVASGSGDIHVGTTGATAVAKTGSGGFAVDRADADVSITTASGDVAIGVQQQGSLTTRTASGSVAVGVPGGVPVWTDISSVSGRLRSDLASVGEPGHGQAHLELRITTASGDITLHQL